MIEETKDNFENRIEVLEKQLDEAAAFKKAQTVAEIRMLKEIAILTHKK